MTETSLKFKAVSKENGDCKIVDEKYVRKALSGHYKDVDLTFQFILDGARANTLFESFEIIRPLH